MKSCVAAAFAAACMSVLLLVPNARAQAFDPNDEDQDNYVRGNLYFLAYHEVGHLMIDQLLQLDQSSDRLTAESAADDIATWLILPDEDEPEQDDEIWAAMEGWLDSAELQSEEAQNPHYPSDIERASRIACYLYGSNPPLYQDLARAFHTAIASVNCVEEFEALHADIVDLFGEHIIPPAHPAGRMQVRYENAGPSLARARAYLMQTHVLEDVADDINEFVALPQDVELVAQSCGGGVAEFRYNVEEGKIIACYEAVAWFMNDAPTEEGERTAARASGSELGSGGARVPRRPRPRN